MDAIWTCRLAIVAAIVGQSASSPAQNAPTDPVKVLVGQLDLDTYKATIKGLVESRCGAVAVGRTYLLPPLSSGGALVVRP
jgi:hypothetical protein